MSQISKNTNKCGKLVSTNKNYGIQTRSQSKKLFEKEKKSTSRYLRSTQKNLNLHGIKINKIMNKFCKTFNQAPNDETKREIHYKELVKISPILSQKIEELKNETDYYEINHELLDCLNNYFEDNIKLPKFYDAIHSYYLINKIIKELFPGIKNIPSTDKLWDLRLMVLRKVFESQHSTTKENFKNFY